MQQQREQIQSVCPQALLKKLTFPFWVTDAEEAVEAKQKAKGGERKSHHSLEWFYTMYYNITNSRMRDDPLDVGKRGYFGFRLFYDL